MGRIKTDLIKRVTRKVMEKHGEKFADDFETNKRVIIEHVDLPSKKIRNTVAGYVTRMVKQKKSPKARRIRIDKSEEAWQ